MGVSEKILVECKEKLLSQKSELMNRVRTQRIEHRDRDKRGDEVDSAVNILAEDQFLLDQSRLKTQLVEIEQALARIEQGSFGICEETEEFIEVNRLLAIPWTRLSLEGAEIRDEMTKRYAK